MQNAMVVPMNVGMCHPYHDGIYEMTNFDKF